MSNRFSLSLAAAMSLMLASVGCAKLETTVQLALTPGDGGTLTASPQGQACSGCATGTVTFPVGTQVTITATPNAGFALVGFTGDCSGPGPCQVIMNGHHQVGAVFGPAPETLNVAFNGTGGGTVASSPAGINCNGACSATFNHGAQVTLTATPDASSSFVGWAGACQGTDPCTVTLNAAASVEARFALLKHTVMVTSTGPGVVTSVPSSLFCGAACSGTFDVGSTVTLVPSPTAGATFAGWGGDCGGTGACTVKMDEDMLITASFTYELSSVTVATTGTGGGSIASIPSGIDCGSTCTASFQAGEMVVLTATPDATSTFAGWSGDCTGKGVCVVAAGQPHAVTAQFDPALFPLTVATVGQGSVSSADGSISCGATCQGTYPLGTTVTLTATPSSGYTFNGWSGACLGTGQCKVVIGQSQLVVAQFAKANVVTVSTTLTNGPANPTRQTTASFWFTGTPATATFVCSLDGATPEACTSPASYAGLTNGAHTFTVAAVANGQTDPAPATYNWTIDTVPPVTSFTSRPNDPTNVTAPTFAFTSNEGGSTFTCRLDGAAPTVCTSPLTLSPLADGTHTFVVTATDPAGNTDPTPAAYAWVVDTVQPDTTIAAGPADPSNDTNPSFSFFSNKPGTFACSLDGAAPSSCSSGLQVGPLGNGPHSFSVAATDLAGNTDATPATWAWNVDTVLPVVSALTVTPSYAMSGTTINISFAVSKPLSGPPTITIGSDSWSQPTTAPVDHGDGTWSATYTAAGWEPQGPATVSVSVTDLANNVGVASGSVTLDYTPPFFNVSATPAYATVGNTVTITAAASEMLQGTPTATIAGRTLTPSSSNGLTYTFTTQVQAGDSTGPQSIAVNGVDLAGNNGGGGTSVTFKFQVNVSRAKITLLRTAYGATKTVTGAPGATDPSATVAVYKDAAATQLLGSGTAAGDGSFSVSVGTADLLTAYLVMTDLAGNISPATQPGQAQATLSLAGVAQGAVSHTGYYRNRVNELAPPTAPAESGADAVPFGTTDFAGLATADGTTTTVDLTPRTLGWQGIRPPQASSLAMAYDPVAGRTMALIGTNPEKVNWAWNGSSWTAISVQGTQDWNGYAMSWDGVNQRLLLWAGSSCCGALIPTTYEWTGKSWQVLSPNTTPAMRQGPSLAWDSDRNIVVMYGGSSKTETWEWNGSDWTNKTPASGNPPGTQQAPMTYDGTHHYMLLQAGTTTYAWNGTAWSQLTTSGPSGNGGDTMVWDAKRGVVVFHGSGGQTWEWNGSWTRITATNEPGSLYGAILVYDATRQTTFMHGGSGHAESYTWDGATWTMVSGQSPSSRAYQNMTYDAVHSQVVMYGGEYAPSDTWVWNGSKWSQAQASNSTVGARAYLGMASGGGLVLLQGGYNQNAGYFSDTYTWDGSTWTAVTGASPGQHAYHGLAWDPWRSNFVLYGGNSSSGSLSDTWLFTQASGWAKQAVSGPGARSGPAMTAFPPQQTVILQGGNGQTDTWSWNGTAWTQVQPLISGTPGPGVSQGKEIIYDDTRNRLVLLDPSAGSYTWEWDGGTWRRATLYPAAGRTDGCSMAWQEPLSQAVLFCGAGSYSHYYPTGDTWAYTPPRYEAQVVQFNVGSSAPPTALNVKAVAGGSGDAGGGAQTKGVRLLAWNATRQLWADVGANTAGDTDAQAQRTIAPAALATPSQYASNGQITLMLMPANPAGAVDSEMAADYVEADVTYPIP